MCFRTKRCVPAQKYTQAHHLDCINLHILMRRMTSRVTKKCRSDRAQLFGLPSGVNRTLCTIRTTNTINDIDWELTVSTIRSQGCHGCICHTSIFVDFATCSVGRLFLVADKTHCSCC
jgi:hypothetical protein